MILLIDISATGEVTAAQVQSSPGHGLDKAALAAAKRLRFKPAEIDGQAYPGHKTRPQALNSHEKEL